MLNIFKEFNCLGVEEMLCVYLYCMYGAIYMLIH